MNPPGPPPCGASRFCGASPAVATSRPRWHPCSRTARTEAAPGIHPTGGFVVPGLISSHSPLHYELHMGVRQRRRPVSKTGVCGFESCRPCECPFAPFSGEERARFFDNSTVEDTLFPSAARPIWTPADTAGPSAAADRRQSPWAAPGERPRRAPGLMVKRDHTCLASRSSGFDSLSVHGASRARHRRRRRASQPSVGQLGRPVCLGSRRSQVRILPLGRETPTPQKPKW